MKIATTLTPQKLSALAVQSGLTAPQIETFIFGSQHLHTTLTVTARNKNGELASRFLSSLVGKGLATYAR